MLFAPHDFDVIGAAEFRDEGGALTTTHPRPEGGMVEGRGTLVGLGALIWWIGVDEDVIGRRGVVGEGEGDVEVAEARNTTLGFVIRLCGIVVTAKTLEPTTTKRRPEADKASSRRRGSRLQRRILGLSASLWSPRSLQNFITAGRKITNSGLLRRALPKHLREYSDFPKEPTRESSIRAHAGWIMGKMINL